jgi:hypothetical protein
MLHMRNGAYSDDRQCFLQYKPKRCELHPEVGQGRSFVRKNERPSATPQNFSITAKDHKSGETIKLFVCVVLVPELAFKLGFVFLVHPGKV